MSIDASYRPPNSILPIERGPIEPPIGGAYGAGGIPSPYGGFRGGGFPSFDGIGAAPQSPYGSHGGYGSGSAGSAGNVLTPFINFMSGLVGNIGSLFGGSL